MHIKIYLSLVLSFCWVFSWGQTKISFESIRTEINKNDSNLCYPKLMERYMKGDTSMTLPEISNCYYGYVFQEEYRPYNFVDRIGLVDTLLSKPNFKFDSLLIYQKLDSTAKEYPFDLKTLLYMIRYFRNSEASQVAKNKIRLISRAILYSGDGISENSPMIVIDIPHELIAIKYLSLSRGRKQFLSQSGLDVISVKKNKNGVKRLYFDVRHMKPNESLKSLLSHQFYHSYLNYRRELFDLD